MALPATRHKAISAKATPPVAENHKKTNKSPSYSPGVTYNSDLHHLLFIDRPQGNSSCLRYQCSALQNDNKV